MGKAELGGVLGSPWAHSWQEVLDALRVSAESGLNSVEVRRRRKRYGPNRLREAKARSAWLILAEQFRSLMIVLLAAAAALSFVLGDWVEGLAIMAVIFINAGIGFLTELRAVRSMEALYRMGRVTARVRREGRTQEILSEDLVPGDIVLLEGGDVIAADLRLTEASKLQVDESALTGESFPVSKDAGPLSPDTSLAERANMVFKGTAVTRGSGEGLVVATGMGTELGQISSLVEETKDEETPLERRLDQMSRRLIWVTLAIVVLVAAAGILAGKEMFLMIETAIALAVAAVPEGLPIVATIALARGMWRMARRNALINRLSAVETLGATNVICTDKTGTLTENRMAVSEIVLESQTIPFDGDGVLAESGVSKDRKSVDFSKNRILREALEVGVLCNNASLDIHDSERIRAIGDPLEAALLFAGARAQIHREELNRKLPEVREEAFDSDVKMMATFHRDEDRFKVAVKGAPEVVLEVSSQIRTIEGQRAMGVTDRKRWLRRNEEMAEKGLRVLALATKEVATIDAEPYDQLIFLGLVGLIDPPRSDVRQAITSCRDAGIRVIMVTGDQAETARNVGLAVDLIDTTDGVAVVPGKEIGNPDRLSEADRKRLLQVLIFARVSPKQKLDLIALHQGNNSVVAMTGDGVNDAPALKKADIGVAMGQRGTQVAREAADMILKDDAFPTIVVAIEQGRVIFNNIRKFVLYLISCNVSEIMAVSLASLVNAPLPILPLQILFLNLVTDVFPALALGVGEGDPTIMNDRPRDPREPILTRHHWLAIGGYGLTMTLSVLGALTLALIWLKMGEGQAVTVSFLTLAFTQLWHVFNMRDRRSGLILNEITRNPFVWGALALCVTLLLLAVYIPGLASVLKLENPGATGWILVIVMSLIPCLLGQILKSKGLDWRAAKR
ncbi:MAG: HAD-IC family P-type ATPase [Proteobacteria bacterium]|nr:HAD-IC family P-type ATPase [Pseudomonadota bacterium]NIS70143.1 HAD-IC family P-type ATPase [Pseudomonadota bacterium]